MKPILYHYPYSPPVRSVYMVAQELGLELDKREINFTTGEQLKPEFLEINPQHTIPTLDDNGYILWESNAICTYLIDKYAKNDQLYPKDLQIRSTINQRLHFNAGIIFPALRNGFFPILTKGQPEFIESQYEAVRNAYRLLNALFRGNTCLVGNSLTVADLCTITNVSQMEYILPVDNVAYPNVRLWLNRMKLLPYYNELNEKIINEFGIVLAGIMDKNKAAAAVI